MKKFHNKHVGQTCIIMGNGPSLNKVPMEFISAYHTFGTNRVYLKYIPDYYVCTNPLVIQQNKKDIEELNCEKFIRQGMIENVNQLKISTKKQFSLRPDEWVYEGYTVTFVCLQLAYYMGFETVFLVGVDHRYKFDGQPNEKKYMPHDDPNHFDPEYFKGQEWHNPDLEQSEYSYRLARAQFERVGRLILNLTPGTALNVFKKADLKKIGMPYD